LVILDLPIDEEPTKIVVDEGTSPFGMVNSFGLLELLFTHTQLLLPLNLLQVLPIDFVAL
jgi:hypothetical protein